MADPHARFDALYRECARSVIAYLRRRASHDDALEVAAEVFTVVWRRLDEVPDPALPWLFGVCRRQLANHRRGARRRLALVQRVGQQPAPLVEQPEPVDGRLGRALTELSEDDRELVLLIGWEGLSPTEAADVLDILPATARTRLHRARRRLEAALQDQEERR